MRLDLTAALAGLRTLLERAGVLEALPPFAPATAPLPVGAGLEPAPAPAGGIPPPETRKEPRMSIASQDIFDPLKADVDPLLSELFDGVSAALQTYMSKSAATASLAPFAGLLAQLAGVAAHSAVDKALGITPAAPSPAPAS